MEFNTEINERKDFPAFEVIQRITFLCPHCNEEITKIIPKDQLNYALAFDKLQEAFMNYRGAVNEMIKVMGKDAGHLIGMAMQEIIRDGVRTYQQKLNES